MAEDITYIIKARNDSRRVAKAFVADMRKAGVSTRQIGENAKRASTETRKVADHARRIAPGLKAANTQATLLQRGMRNVARGVAGLVAGFAGFQVLTGAVASAREFSAALGETSTLIAGTPAELKQLEDAASSLVTTYGGSAADQIRGFYQAISAGASDIGEANELVDAANKLAIGGVTDVTTGVDILTTVVNAYGRDTITVQEASDALFTGMRLGKTTVGELSSTLGRVIPIAKAAGVGFDELVGTVATLTTKGISTAEAITGVRGVLAAIVKPTSEAEKAAERLGISFNVAGIEAAGGFSDFLGEVIEKTGGSTEELAKLFTGVEGLTPILSLATGGSEDLARILAELAEKAGATDTAYGQMADTLEQRLVVATDSMRESNRKLGSEMLKVLVPAMELAAVAVTFVSENMDILAIAVTAMAVTQLPKLWTVLATQVVPIFAAFRNAILAATVAMGISGGIGLRGAIAAVMTLLRSLFVLLLTNPLVAFAVAAGLAFIVLRGKLDPVIDKIKELIAAAEKGLRALGALAGFDTGIGEGLAPAARSRGEDIRLRSGAAAEREASTSGTTIVDADGNFVTLGGDDVDTSAELANNRTSTATPTGGSSDTKGGGGGAKNALADAVKSLTANFREQAEVAGLVGRELEDYKIRQQLLQAAQQDGVELSPEVVAGVLAQRDAMLEAKEAADTFSLGVRQGWDDIVNSVQSNAEVARSLTVDAFTSMKDAITGFVKTGKLDFKSLIIDMLANISAFLANRLVIDFLGIGGNGTGGTGGKGTIDFLSSALGGIFGRETGGPVQAGVPYIVGEKRPEIFVPNQSGRILPDASQGVAAGGGGNTFQISFNFPNSDPETFKRSEGQIRARMSRVIADADRRNN